MKLQLGIALALHAAFLAAGARWARQTPHEAPHRAPSAGDPIAVTTELAGPPRLAAPPTTPELAGGRSAKRAARARPGATRRSAETMLAEAPDARLDTWFARVHDAFGGVVASLAAGEGVGTGAPCAAPPRRPHGLGERWDSVAGPHADDLPARAAEADARTLPRRAVEGAVSRSASRLRACYDDGLRREPDLAGQILVRFLVDPGGSVVVASDGGSTVADPAAVRCVLATFAAMGFPRSEGGEPVWGTYLVTFPPS